MCEARGLDRSAVGRPPGYASGPAPNRFDSELRTMMKAFLRLCYNRWACALTTAQLLGEDAVRLYQSSAFYKRPSHGETSWHTDLHTAPLDTNAMATVCVNVHINIDIVKDMCM